MIVIFEGIDKVGKTTLIKAFGAAEGYKSLCMDRGPAGYFFYDIIFDRLNNERLENIVGEIHDINRTKHIIVYLYANPEVVSHRLDENKEKYIYPIDIFTAMTMYQAITKSMYFDDTIISLNTAEKTIDECVKKIIDEVSADEKRCYFSHSK